MANASAAADELVQRRLRVARKWRNDIEGLGRLLSAHLPHFARK
jgi:hypothetical protein